jgi:flagellar protein FlbD
MITLTRLNGQTFAINPDHIERIDVTPDTVICLLEGTKYVVSEGLDEIVRRIRDYRASVIAVAAQLESPGPSSRSLRLVTGDADARPSGPTSVAPTSVPPISVAPIAGVAPISRVEG